MEFLRSLRERAGKSLLAGKVARIKRKPVYTSFYNVRSIGLVWDASRTEEFITLSRFHQKMSERDIEVRIFGFFPGRVLPDQFTAIRYFTCLKKQDIDFLYRPITSESSSFTGFHFDVLIDINFRNIFTLHYITSLSKAGLKVGLADSRPESSPFDLMISLTNPVNVSSYLDQVLYYLDKINSESDKKLLN